MKALVIAFSMYSKIPMPYFMWEEKDRKRAMYFFPLVGVAVGAVFLLIFEILCRLRVSGLVRGAVLLSIPLLITGGIHMDGFLDTCDARASYGDRERKLEILKDSHVGAFAVISGGLLLILLFAAFTAFEEEEAAAMAVAFVLSRAMSGLAAAVFPGARERGMLADFMKDTNRRRIAAVMVLYMAAAGVLLWGIGPVWFVLVFAGAFLAFFHYRHVALSEFGGVTGDLAGYFLTLCELMTALVLALASGIV